MGQFFTFLILTIGTDEASTCCTFKAEAKGRAESGSRFPKPEFRSRQKKARLRNNAMNAPLKKPLKNIIF